MDVRAGFKQTEVGAIPQDWEVKLLPEVCRFRGGKAHEPYISDFGQFVCVNSKFVSTEGRVRKFSSANLCRAKRDDILLVMSDLPNGKALAKAFRVDQDGLYAVNQRVCALTPYRDCAMYLFYVLNRNPYFLKFDDGVNQTHLLNRVFQKVSLALPPTIAEQEVIAEPLSDVDALINSLEQLLEKKRQTKRGAMQELLTGKKRLPGFEIEHGYKQTEVGVIPEDWEVKPLGTLATLYQPATISAKQFTEGGFPVYGANGVVGFYGKSNHETWQVTVTCRGSTCGTVNRTVDRCWITGNAMVLNCDHIGSLCKEFLYHLMCVQDLSDCITGTGQPQIVRSPLAAFCVPLPTSKAEQGAIATVLSDMDAEIAALETKTGKVRRLKHGMMQELLTGRIRLV